MINFMLHNLFNHNFKNIGKPGVHAYDSSTWEAQAGGLYI
jgi:hypothetical protein